MKLPIGFHLPKERTDVPAQPEAVRPPEVTPTMVLVRLPGCQIPLSYYNDRFELKTGDIVFVEGKFEGVPGRVEKVSSQFHVDLEAFKKVLGVADTNVRGEFRQVGSHFITFDPGVLPYQKALSWYKAVNGQTHYIKYDAEGFCLEDPSAWPFSGEIIKRGVDYYKQNKVAYLCMEGERGRAVVKGTGAYEVSFFYEDGRISELTCDCPCGTFCKHEAAALFQLKETLELIAKKYQAEYEAVGYFAVVDRGSFYTFAINGNEDAVVQVG